MFGRWNLWKTEAGCIYKRAAKNSKGEEKRLIICILCSIVKTLLKLVEIENFSKPGSNSPVKAHLLAQ